MICVTSVYGWRRICRAACRRLSLRLLVSVGLLAWAGCAFQPSGLTGLQPRLSGTAYTYQPLNPTTVWIRDPTEDEQMRLRCRDADETSVEFSRALLRDLDTETVRIAVNTLDGNVDLTSGVVGTSVKGQSYVLIVDYIKYFTGSHPVDVNYTCKNRRGNEETKHFASTVPIYIGIGFRIRAEFQALATGLNISGLPALAIAASANGIAGRLTVQTLGVTGPEVTNLLPLLSDISVSSIQSAVQAVGAIKAKIYEESTTVYPKIVGFESPETDPALVRAITEKLYALEIWMCPVVIENPQDKTKNILWLNWFSDPPEESNAAGRGTAPNNQKEDVGKREEKKPSP
jgi:hypothetical protein